MFFRQVWLVLTITTIMFQNVCFTSACKPQKFAHDTSFEHYSRLKEIDTGYSFNEKPNILKEEATENPESLLQAIQNLYHQLLCCYTFNMVHYMNLLERLFSKNGKSELNRLVKGKVSTVDFLKDNCIKTLNVLYHFGRLDDMGPIWLVYMFVTYLESIDKSKLSAKRDSILKEHEHFNQKLADMHNEQMCNTQNKYNDLYIGSDYFNRLEAFQSNPTHQHPIVNYIVSLGGTLNNIYYKIDNLLKIDHNCNYFFFGFHLQLNRVWKQKNIVRNFLVDFAEMTDWEKKYAHIKNVYDKNQFESAQELIENVAESQSLFTNLVKFTIFLNVWKHITLINLSLHEITDIEEQPHRLWDPWANHVESINQIGDLNRSMFDYTKLIIKHFNLKNDLRLAFLTSLIEMPPNSFTDVQVNKINKLELSKHMDNIYSELFGCETKLIRSSNRVTSHYIERRVEIFNKICEKHNIIFKPDELIHDRFFESVVSNCLFYSFMKDVFFKERYVETMDFDVIRSFIDFSDKFLSISIVISSD